jgi:predicted nucleic acid-binding protein
MREISSRCACEERLDVKLMLDTNVLLEVCTPGRHQDAKEWFRRILLAPSPPELLASVVAVYELRAALDLKGATRSLEHFEEMSKSLRFVPLSVEAMQQAASLASRTRREGTRRGPLSDSDAIIAAQALVEGAIVVTADRVFHSVPGLEARHWNELDPDRLADVEPRVAPTDQGQ